MSEKIIKTIEMTKEHYEICKGRAEKLDGILAGDFFKYDGNLYPINGEDEYWLNSTNGNSYYLDDDGFYYYEINGEKIVADDVSPYTIYDYFCEMEVFDVKYIVDDTSRGLIYNSVRVCTDTGGPGIYLDTFEKKVQLYWWSEYAEYELSHDVVEAIDEYWEEMYRINSL